MIGSSDATALLSALYRKSDVQLVHGPMVQYLVDIDEESRNRIRGVVDGQWPASLHGRQISGPTNPVEAWVVGGNLTVLASLVGTPWVLPSEGAIVVIEDVGEKPYRIDRCLAQLRWGAAVEGIAGVVLGDFIRCDPGPHVTYSVLDVLQAPLAPLGVPLIADAPVGHGARNHAWRYGCRASLVNGELLFI